MTCEVLNELLVPQESALPRQQSGASELGAPEARRALSAKRQASLRLEEARSQGAKKGSVLPLLSPGSEKIEDVHGFSWICMGFLRFPKGFRSISFGFDGFASRCGASLEPQRSGRQSD